MTYSANEIPINETETAKRYMETNVRMRMVRIITANTLMSRIRRDENRACMIDNTHTRVDARKKKLDGKEIEGSFADNLS